MHQYGTVANIICVEIFNLKIINLKRCLQKFMLNQLKGYALMVSHEPDRAFAAFSGNLGAAPDLGKFPPIESDFEKRKKMLRDVYRLSDEEIIGMLDALRYSLEA